MKVLALRKAFKIFSTVPARNERCWTLNSKAITRVGKSYMRSMPTVSTRYENENEKSIGALERLVSRDVFHQL